MNDLGRRPVGPDATVDLVEAELSRLARRLERVRLSASGGDVALERAAYTLLRELHDAGPERLTVMAARLGLDTSTVSRQIAMLETAGLVRRDPDPDDRRAHLVGVSAAGERALRETRAARRRLFDDVMAGWSEEDRRRFADLLRRFNDEITERRAAPGPAARSTARAATR